jgi:hypothetical protein
MELIDNISNLLGDNLKQTIAPGSRSSNRRVLLFHLRLRGTEKELERIDSLEFIFTSLRLSFPSEVTDGIKKERREFHIPKADARKASTAPSSRSSSRTS